MSIPFRIFPLAAFVVLSACATIGSPEQQCQTLAGDHGMTLGSPDPALTEYVIDAGSRTFVWPASSHTPEVRCTVRDGRVRSLFAGDRPIFRESAGQ